MFSMLLCLLLLSVTVTSAWPYDHVLVETANGPVQGDVLTLHNDVKINTFLGVPYAEPPVGPLRWRAPESLDAWTEPFIADRLGAACTPTAPTALNTVGLTNPDWDLYSEDCLNVNVYAPNATSTETNGYPVLVWFYGGAFTDGANVQYPGHFLASKGIIVVIPNYRLNVIGFLTTSDAAARGNYGMLDQVAALRWVQNNIAAFGGDFSRVTIAGESAGGASTGLHLLSSMSEGLFHRAWISSGCEVSSWVVQPPENHPENTALHLAQQHNCPTDDSFEMIECLRGVEARDLTRSMLNCSICGDYNGQTPVVDGVFITDMPRELRKAGRVNRVPEVIGINREESSIVFPYWLPDTQVNRTEFEAAVADFINTNVHVDDPGRQEDLIQTLIWYYAPWPHIDDLDANNHQLIMMTTDAVYGFDADYQMKMHMRSPAITYQYLFAYISDNSTLPEYMGTPHMLELPYFWGYPLLQLNPDVRNQSGVVDNFGYTQTDITWAEYWMTLVTNYVKTGEPTSTPVQSPIGGESVSWPQAIEESLRYLFVSNDVIEGRENYRQQEYALWHSFLNTMIKRNEWPFPYSVDTNTKQTQIKKIMANPSKYMKALLERSTAN